MNLILLRPTDFVSSDRVRLFGRRLEHIIKVHRAREGDTLRVGLVNDTMGKATIVELNETSIEMQVMLGTPPPPPLPLTLLLALPRPKSLRKVLLSATAMGVKRIVLMRSRRVEKSFWDSVVLRPEKLEHILTLGLEQAKDTIMPTIEMQRLFRPFVEDRVPEIIQGSMAIAAHPHAPTQCPRAVKEPVVLAVGPEGGFIDYEIDLLAGQGFEIVSIGERVLRVETAVPAILGRLF